MDKTYNILLVDDEPGVRESVQAYLDDDENLAVTAAESATKALELLQTFTPDLVISDIMMPQMSGYDFLEKLREDPRFKTLPVVFLTARGMTSDRIQGYQAGCDAYLPKPFEPEELEAIVKNLLTRDAAIAESQGGGDANLDGIAKDLKEIKQFLGQQNQLVTTPPPLKIDLTPREQSVLDLVAQGLMNKEIAKQLETSVRNVEKYVSRLFGKTGTNSRTELVRYALKHGLTQ
ncbi:two component transcriptional regulator, LuxR family [[Leptolyngbya] sp. PCC 7376]|uniref:response regulator transcription factor n=1 Tax=[Leptolyngbya] sp. PCC 7376 TaxID=111781 RepID=UPI00029F3127|nr:response regulator transcription factor [[Leptolyngbya] sp. PCC 7376]AFY38501.1 two component transcriptional regulator, LuxR family [[Leptolyngbya] sp. PCC 7376]